MKKMRKTISVGTLEKVQLYQFRKGVSSLLVTRSIFLAFTILTSLGSLFLKIFLGSVADWLFPSQVMQVSTLSMGFVAFAYLILSVPRLIGNIIYIKHLKELAHQFKDQNMLNAYRKQVFRVVCYILMIIVFSCLIGSILSILNRFFYIYSNNNSITNVISAVGSFTDYYELTPGIYALLVLYGIITFSEKLLNISTWHELQKWFKLQYHAIEDSQRESLDMIVMGNEHIKIGNIVNFFEGLIGNLIFNLGLYKLNKGLQVLIPQLKSVEIEVSEQRPVYPVYHRMRPSPHVYSNNQIDHPQTVIVSQQSHATQTTFAHNDYKVEDRRLSILYCGYCGTKVNFPNARFCSKCGNELN